MKTKYYLVESATDGTPMYTATESDLTWLKTHFVPETEDDCFDDNYLVTPLKLIKEFKQTVFLFETEDEDKTSFDYEPDYVLSEKDYTHTHQIPCVYAMHECLLDVLDDWTELITHRPKYILLIDDERIEFDTKEQMENCTHALDECGYAYSYKIKLPKRISERM